jgi:hypothetical protein
VVGIGVVVERIAHLNAVRLLLISPETPTRWTDHLPAEHQLPLGVA